MHKSHLTLARLRALETVARLGSFSDAADALGMSQPSVSNHVRALEQAYAAALLDRRGPRVVASRALEPLLPQIRAMLVLSDELDAQLSRQRDAETGTLRIGYSTYQIAMPILSRFLQAAPGIRLEARAAATDDLLRWLDASDIDAGFVTGRDMPAGLTGVPVLSSRIVLAVPPHHALAGQGRVGWGAVAGVPLIQRESASGTRRIFEAAAVLARVRLDTRLVLGSWGSIAAMVRAGAGAGVALAAEVQPSDGLSVVEIDDPALVAGHYVVCLPDLAHIAAVQRLMTLVRMEGKTLVSEAAS